MGEWSDGVVEEWSDGVVEEWSDGVVEEWRNELLDKPETCEAKQVKRSKPVWIRMGNLKIITFAILIYTIHRFGYGAK